MQKWSDIPPKNVQNWFNIPHKIVQKWSDIPPQNVQNWSDIPPQNVQFFLHEGEEICIKATEKETFRATERMEDEQESKIAHFFGRVRWGTCAEL